MLNRFDVHNSETLNIQIDRHDQKSYLIELSKDCTKLDLRVECLENSFSKFFILNHAENACELNINMVLKQDANCQMGVLDLEKSPLKWNHYVDLQESGAEYEILSGQLCQEHIEKVDQEGYEWIEKEYHVTANKEDDKQPISLGSCGAKKYA